MARQRIKPKELQALREGLNAQPKPRVAKGHTVSKAARVHDNERKYQRGRDKRVKTEDLE